MGGMADDVVFEHWNGRVTQGKDTLRRIWQPWFEKRDFHFATKALNFDEARQSISFEWTLRWPSPESIFLGRDEIREGVDVLQLHEGKIISKRSYIKSVLNIEGRPVWLKGTDPNRAARQKFT